MSMTNEFDCLPTLLRIERLLQSQLQLSLPKQPHWEYYTEWETLSESWGRERRIKIKKKFVAESGYVFRTEDVGYAPRCLSRG